MFPVPQAMRRAPPVAEKTSANWTLESKKTSHFSCVVLSIVFLSLLLETAGHFL